MESISLLPLIGLLLAFSNKLVDFAKFLRAGDTNAWVTQATTWVAGIITVFVASAAHLGDVLAGVGVGGAETLSDLNGASKVLSGVLLSSVGSLIYDFKKAFDNTQTSATPSLLTGEKTVLVEVVDTAVEG